MTHFRISILKKALKDIDDLAVFISENYQAPLTARKYVAELWFEIRKLEANGESIPVSQYKDVLKYGKNARSIRYKSHIVIYTIQNDTVVIRKITIAALIKS